MKVWKDGSHNNFSFSREIQG